MNVTIGVPHAADAVAVPRAALISDTLGLQPSVGVAPVIVMVGGLGAFVHVTVLEVVALLPQPSTAVNVLVCEAEQEVVDIVPSTKLRVGVPQASVAVAVPRAAAISDAVGLHPRVKVVPVAVMVGATWSAVHVTVLEVVAVLPQASIAVNVLVCEAEQEVVDIVPSVKLTVVVPQASLAVAVPRAALISDAVGLHAKVFVVPVAVMVGGI